MSIRRTWIVAAALALVTMLAIVLVDAPLARAIGGGASWPSRPLVVLELVTGMTIAGWPIDKLLLGAIVIGAGAALWAWRAPLGRAVVLIGLVDLTTRLVAASLKAPFGRLRPREALADGVDLAAAFFRDGIAFPSGHVAHFAGLAFPIAVLRPRAAPYAFAIAAYVALARIATNDHFLGDTLASAALAAAFTAAFANLLDSNQRAR